VTGQSDICHLRERAKTNSVYPFSTALQESYGRTQRAMAGPGLLEHEAVSVSPFFVIEITPCGHVTDASDSPGPQAKLQFDELQVSCLTTCKPCEAAPVAPSPFGPGSPLSPLSPFSLVAPRALRTRRSLLPFRSGRSGLTLLAFRPGHSGFAP
jgi:hypothetical protein